MAKAALINGVELDGGTGYEIDTYPFDERNVFKGPEDRSWDAFELVPGRGARFQWRTRNDCVRAAATALIEGRIGAKEALDDWCVSEWLARHAETIDDLLEEEHPGVADLPREAWSELALRELGRQVSDGDFLNCYEREEDTFLHDAASALDLPPWATTASAASGGPGSGFNAAYVVLAKGKTLEDLAAWLAKRVERGSRPGGKRPPKA